MTEKDQQQQKDRRVYDTKRHKENLARFSEINLHLEKQDKSIEAIKKIAEHNEPSPKTLAMFDEIKGEFSQAMKISDDAMLEQVQKTIKEVVNGKIDSISSKLDAHIASRILNDANTAAFILSQTAMNVRIEPYIKEAEANKIVHEGVASYGKRVIFWSQVIIATGIILTFIAGIVYFFNR